MAFDIRCNIDISENENMHYRHTNIKWREALRDEVWYLIVSIPDLCNLTYFDYTKYGTKAAAAAVAVAVAVAVVVAAAATLHCPADMND